MTADYLDIQGALIVHTRIRYEGRRPTDHELLLLSVFSCSFECIKWFSFKSKLSNCQARLHTWYTIVIIYQTSMHSVSLYRSRASRTTSTEKLEGYHSLKKGNKDH